MSLSIDQPIRKILQATALQDLSRDEQIFKEDYEHLCQLKKAANQTTFEIVSEVLTNLSALNLYLTCEETQMQRQQIRELQAQVEQLAQSVAQGNRNVQLNMKLKNRYP